MTSSADQPIHWSIVQIFFVKRQRRIGLIGYVLFFVTALAFSANYRNVRAADGNLDPGFGIGGKVNTNTSNLNDDYGTSVAIQPDGKIIAGGRSGIYPLFHSALMRYNTDGSLDQTFGSGGISVVPLDGGGDGISDLVLQPDGKIVASGTLIQNNFTVGCLVARFNSDGSLDRTFGNGGKVIFNFGDNASEGNAVVLQTDGKILVVGVSGAGSYSELNDFALARFNSDGSFDQSYGSGGKFKTHFDGQFNTGSRAMSAVLQPDGRLVVAGSYKNEGSSRQFALARYNADGSLDTFFGSGGEMTTSLGSADSFGTAVVLQRDGKIVLGGYFDAGRRNHDFALARYNSDGTLDTTFGSGGRVINDLFGTSDDIIYSLVVQPDGKLIASGRTGQYPNFKFGLARYSINGAFDQSFGSAGKVMTDFGTTSSQSYSSALQSDGKIVLAGYTIVGSSGADFNANFAVARYLAIPTRLTRFDFDGDSRTDISVYRGGTWYLNRSTAGVLGFQFGLNTDLIVPADYDGDGKTDIAVFRPSEGNWYCFNSGSGSYSISHFGASGDIPVPGDYDGDGRADAAVFRGGVWYIQRSTAGFVSVQFGLAADKPVAADYDGDGKADIAVYRDGTWYVQKSTGNYLITQFGISTDKPVTADYDGDGKSDIAVFRLSEGNWYIVESAAGSVKIVHWGLAGDVPVPADYDGDGKADIAINRNGGEWWIYQSSTNNYAFQQFGISDDIPVPSAFVR
ncbi:MAG TPA: FG-GAP-like repeat-containing protein [Pyrinomonadaceae bacterium]|jgi:uncharacterized delta-60 repeat protein